MTRTATGFSTRTSQVSRGALFLRDPGGRLSPAPENSESFVASKTVTVIDGVIASGSITAPMSGYVIVTTGMITYAPSDFDPSTLN